MGSLDDGARRGDLLFVLVAGTSAMFLLTLLSIFHTLWSFLAPLLQDGIWGAFPEPVRLPILTTAASILVIGGCGVRVAVLPSLRQDVRAHDLLYYLGFIGTLFGLLGASFALAIGLEGADGVNPVPILVAQNGIALSTTLLGMFLRNWLSYRYTPAEPDVSLLLTQVSESARIASKSVGELSQQVQTYATAVTGFSQALGEASSAVSNDVTAWNDFSSSAQSAKSAVSEASQSVAGVAGSVRKVGVEAYQMAHHLGAALQNLQTQMAEVSTQLDAVRSASGRRPAAGPENDGIFSFLNSGGPRRRSAPR